MSLGCRGPVAGREPVGAVADGGVGVTVAVAGGTPDGAAVELDADGAADEPTEAGPGVATGPRDVESDVGGAVDAAGGGGAGRDVPPRVCRLRVSRRPFISSTRELSVVMVLASPSSRRESAPICRSFSAV